RSWDDRSFVASWDQSLVAVADITITEIISRKKCRVRHKPNCDNFLERLTTLPLSPIMSPPIVTAV
ncbi:MAG: hypothetical protein ACH253_00405, partial [Candidatus Thiodiazotropha sp.]